MYNSNRGNNEWWYASAADWTDLSLQRLGVKLVRIFPGSVSNHYDSNDDSHRGYRDRPPRNTEEDHKGDYRRRDSKGRRRNRWDDEERDSSSSSRNRDKDREYRRHWRDRSRSPVDKQKSPSFRVSKDIFENTEAKKEDSKSRRNNWSESSSDEESGKLRRGNPPYAGDSGSNQYSKSQGSFPVAADVYSNNDKNGNSLSKPNFYQHFSSHNYPVPQQSSEASRIDQTRSMGNLSFPVPAASEISDSKTKIPAAGIQIRLLPQPVTDIA